MSSEAHPYLYPLEALRRKHRWQLEAAQLRLAQCEAVHAEAQVRLRAMQAERSAIAAAARARSQVRLDPDTQRATLMFLLQVDERLRVHQNATDEIEVQRRQLRQLCLSEQQKLEAFERDRARCLADWSHVMRTREGHEQDRDWNARRAWQAPAEHLPASEAQPS